jgi:hypothetical protein
MFDLLEIFRKTYSGTLSAAERIRFPNLLMKYLLETERKVKILLCVF